MLALLCAAPAFAYEGAKEKLEEAPLAKQPQLTRAPELKKFVEAVYPEEAHKQGLTGDVTLLIDIAADGTVPGAEISKSSGRADLDAAALAAVKQFSFTPAELDGVPALVRIEYVYRFVLAEPPKPEEAPPPPPPVVTLKGRIVERGARTAIAGAQVVCLEQSEETLTDTAGNFELHPKPGTCTVQVLSGAHEPTSHAEEIRAGQVLEVTYHLMPKSFGLFQTVVRGEREKREATRRTLEREELLKVPGSMGDPIRVIQNLPGVARAPFLSGQLIVRGAAPGETGTYFDGVEIPLLYHFLGGPSVVNPEFLERIDFIPGGFGVKYGRAIGGILDATTRRANLEEAHGSVKIDLLDSAAFVEVPVAEGTAVAIAARRSYVDVVLPAVTALASSPNGTLSVLPRYWDYQARADHQTKGSKHAFTLMAFGSDDDLVVAATGQQQARDFQLHVNTNFHRLRFTWLFKDGDFTNSFSPFLGRDAITAGFGASSFDQVFKVGGARDELAWTLPGKSVLRLGVDIALEQDVFTVTAPAPPDYREFPGERPVKPNQTFDRKIDNLDYGFYAELELKPTERLTLIPGVRIDQFRLHGVNRTGTDPRFTARYKLLETTSLKGAIGNYTMTPDPAQFDPQFGNPQIGLPKAFQASLGVEHRFTDVINVDLIGFYNRRYNRVVGSSATVVDPDGTVRRENFNNDGLGRAYGLEVLLRHEITSHFFGWLSYTLMKTEEKRVGDEKYVNGSYDETHILTLVGQYKIGNGWEVGSRFRLVTGRPATPVIGSRYDGDTDSYSRLNGEPRSVRARPFRQLDVRIDKTWLFDLWKLGLYLDVQNVTWADNSEGTSYDYRFRTATEIPGLPILPTLGVKGSF